jgi:hypothetical protein
MRTRGWLPNNVAGRAAVVAGCIFFRIAAGGVGLLTCGRLVPHPLPSSSCAARSPRVRHAGDGGARRSCALLARDTDEFTQRVREAGVSGVLRILPTQT